MVPIGSVANFEDRTGPYRVTRYNLFPAVEIDGDTAPGSSSGASLTTMEKPASESLPAGYGTEWTGIAFQAKAAANTAGILFSLSVVFVFPVHPAKYDIILLPLPFIMILPVCLLAHMIRYTMRVRGNIVLTTI